MLRLFKITESKNWLFTAHGYQQATAHAAVKLPRRAVRVLNPRFREIEKTGHFYFVEEMKPGGAAFIFEVTPEPTALLTPPVVTGTLTHEKPD